MSTLVDTGQLDKAKAEQLISTIPLIPEVERIEVELYTDHTGDPAFQIVYYLRKDVVFELNDELGKRFEEFKGVIQTAILHSDLNRFPYTKLERAA